MKIRIPFNSCGNRCKTNACLPRTKSRKAFPLIHPLTALLLILCGAGCASLPNVGPFVDASNQLRSAVAASGTTVEAELSLMPGGTNSAEKLKTQWDSRNKAFAAVAAYSSSLQAIVEAGNEGAASAQKVADSASALASAAGVVMPGSPAAVATATDIAKFIYSQIALARAAKSLQRALEAAQPAIEGISGLIAADLKDLDDIFVSASTETDNAVRTEFSDLMSYRNRLLGQMKQSDPGNAASLSQQVQIGQLLQATDEWHSKYLTRRKEVEGRLRVGRALIQAALQSAHEWGIAHGNVITAVQERRPINTESLTQASIEIQKLVRKVREL